MRPLDLTVLVLTYNEEHHLQRCFESVRAIAKEIIVVDSFSTDRTKNLAEERGATVLQNAWVNYSTQFNWALRNASIRTTWIMRLDADEVVTQELASELRTVLSTTESSGLTVNRRIYFMGRWIRYGGIYPAPMLRIWRNGKGVCEERWMDEHIQVGGAVSHVRGDISDMNLNGISWWVEKHNKYASREAIDLLLLQQAGPSRKSEGVDRRARRKRWLKERIYSRLPLGLRAVAYFFGRYVLMLGFLDGWRGFIFHFFQGLWYRILVDVKVFEIEVAMRRERISLAEAVRREFGHEI
jgi:glycosyltransferase involved in cell wall biosynthesis